MLNVNTVTYLLKYPVGGDITVFYFPSVIPGIIRDKNSGTVMASYV